jgi:hypothetical protein
MAEWLQVGEGMNIRLTSDFPEQHSMSKNTDAMYKSLR